MKVDSNHIVCGRGQSNYNNEGNRIFRQVVARRLPLYMDESTGRTAKTKLVNDTTRKLMQMKLVFVTRSNGDRHWVTLSTDKARTKVAHLFRDSSRQARLRGARSDSSSAVVVSAASDSDESCSPSSLLSSAVDTDIATHSDSDFNIMVSSTATNSDLVVEDRNPDGSASSIVEMVAKSGDGDQKPQVPKVINCEGIPYPLTSSEIEFSDAMKNALNDLRIFASSTHNSLTMSHIIQELETSETLEDDDMRSLSKVEDLEDLRCLTADLRAGESDVDLFWQ